MYEIMEESQGPKHAGLILGIIAILGVGFFGIYYMIDSTGDGLYDTQRPIYEQAITSSKVMEGNDLWTRKKPVDPDPIENTNAKPTPPVFIRKDQPAETPAPAKAPTSQP